MADTNDIWPQWDDGTPVKSGTVVYDGEGHPGTITEVKPGRLKPIAGPYGGAYPPEVRWEYPSQTAGGGTQVFSPMKSSWRIQKQPTEPSKDKPKAVTSSPSFLMRKVGPLPLAGWIGLGGVAAVVLLIFKRK